MLVAASKRDSILITNDTGLEDIAVGTAELRRRLHRRRGESEQCFGGLRLASERRDVSEPRIRRYLRDPLSACAGRRSGVVFRPRLLRGTARRWRSIELLERRFGKVRAADQG
jgi:hypothetical protein